MMDNWLETSTNKSKALKNGSIQLSSMGINFKNAL